MALPWATTKEGIMYLNLPADVPPVIKVEVPAHDYYLDKCPYTSFKF